MNGLSDAKLLSDGAEELAREVMARFELPVPELLPEQMVLEEAGSVKTVYLLVPFEQVAASPQKRNWSVALLLGQRNAAATGPGDPHPSMVVRSDSELQLSGLSLVRSECESAICEAGQGLKRLLGHAPRANGARATASPAETARETPRAGSRGSSVPACPDVSSDWCVFAGGAVCSRRR